MSDNVNYQHKVGTTAALDAIKAAGLLAWDTTKGHAIFYPTTGTLKHIISADTSNNLLGILGNVDVADGAYYGLGTGKGRVQFDDEATDLVTIKDADLAVMTIQGDGDVDTKLSFATNQITVYAGNVNLLDFQAATIEFNVAQADVSYVFNTSGLEALTIAGATGAAVFGGTLQAMRVGIGKGASATLQLEIARSANNCTINSLTYSTTDTHSSIYAFRKSGSNAIGTLAETAAGEFLGQIFSYGVNSSSAEALGSGILFGQDGAGGATNIPSKMDFYTGTSSTEVAARMNINNTGLVTCYAGLSVDGGAVLDGDVCLEDEVLFFAAASATANKWKLEASTTNFYVKYNGTAYLTVTAA